MFVVLGQTYLIIPRHHSIKLRWEYNILLSIPGQGIQNSRLRDWGYAMHASGHYILDDNSWPRCCTNPLCHHIRRTYRSRCTLGPQPQALADPVRHPTISLEKAERTGLALLSVDGAAVAAREQGTSTNLSAAQLARGAQGCRLSRPRRSVSKSFNRKTKLKKQNLK